MFVRLGGGVGRLGSAVPNIERPDPVGRSATPAGSSLSWYRGMRYDNGHVFMTMGNPQNGFSVRCVRDIK